MSASNQTQAYLPDSTSTSDITRNNDYSNFSGENTICEKCFHLDFQKVLCLPEPHINPNANKSRLTKSVLIESFKQGDRFVRSSSCDLCRLLSQAFLVDQKFFGEQGMEGGVSATKDGIETNTGDQLELRALDLSMYLPGAAHPRLPESILRKYYSPWLLIVPSTLVIEDHLSFDIFTWLHEMRNGNQITVYDSAEIGTKLVRGHAVSRDFDVSMVMEWLDFCKANHQTLCNTPPGDITNLELIDCESHTIVSALPGALYLALSYVWGKAPLERQNDRSILPKDLPATILDAIKVTKIMGYRYLWVDRYCIDQNNLVKKLKQIQQMDLIYCNAELTIIGAAGHGDDFGLPGVSARQRKHQPTAKVGNLQFVSLLQGFDMATKSSHWWKRAWTLQEGFLSRRRLIFTEEQTHFECQSMCCSESISRCLYAFYKDAKSIGDIFPGILGYRQAKSTYDISPFSSSYLGYLDLVNDYSARILSYPADSLHGFLGITKFFRKIHDGLLHLWGIPVFVYDDPRERYRESETVLEKSLVFGLTWKHKFNCWNGFHSPIRREAFPSWSWCGWGGAIEYISSLSMTHLEYEITDIHLELGSGHPIIPRDLFQNLSTYDSLSEHPRVLCFCAKIIPPELVESIFTDDKSNTRSRINFYISVGTTDKIGFMADLKSGKYEALWLGQSSDQNFYLVIERNAGAAERIGIIIVGSCYYGWNWKPESWETKSFRLV